MVWVIVIIIMTIGTFVPTKHTNNKDHMCFKNTCKENCIIASCYTKYGFGDFLLKNKETKTNHFFKPKTSKGPKLIDSNEYVIVNYPKPIIL
jgi:hypothetical protein